MSVDSKIKDKDIRKQRVRNHWFLTKALRIGSIILLGVGLLCFFYCIHRNPCFSLNIYVTIALGVALSGPILYIFYKLSFTQFKEKKLGERLRENIVENRIWTLILTAVLGVILACALYCICSAFFDSDGLDSQFISSLLLLALGLPTLFVLWLFRTHDIQQQLFFGALNLFAKSSSSEKTTSDERVIGLKQLLYLRLQNIFIAKIDSITAGSNLSGANLWRADLRGANLQKVNLRAANLQEAQLQEAQLQHAQLQNAHLQHAHLKGVNLQGADLQGAELQHAQLEEAQLQKADLQTANLQHAHLQHAQLQKANLQHAQLQKANLRAANLQEANLQHAQLEEAQLQKADLQKANLQAANLQHAQLQKANLQAANLQEADLQGAHLFGAFYDKDTKFPEGFDPKARGMIDVSILIKKLIK